MSLFEDRGAIFSPCRTWRYTLWRIWERPLGLALWIMCNPSDGDEAEDDKTLKKVRGFTSRAGLGGFVVVNFFGLVDSDPQALLDPARDPIGPENDAHLAREIAAASRLIIGYGDCIPKKLRPRAAQRLAEIRALAGDKPIACLGRTKGGDPRHPLMLAWTTPLETF